MNIQQTTAESPYTCEVVGEHLFDPMCLLVIDEHGRFYALNLLDGHARLTEPGPNWIVDSGDRLHQLPRLNSG